jgi:hypothetical protein
MNLFIMSRRLMLGKACSPAAGSRRARARVTSLSPRRPAGPGSTGRRRSRCNGQITSRQQLVLPETCTLCGNDITTQCAEIIAVESDSTTANSTGAPEMQLASQMWADQPNRP